uniref:Uncharacterized protein n=1 Tax=Oryza brachyantha TaxID=4533 RepID=J3MQD3_ORYBR
MTQTVFSILQIFVSLVIVVNTKLHFVFQSQGHKYLKNWEAGNTKLGSKEEPLALRLVLAHRLLPLPLQFHPLLLVAAATDAAALVILLLLSLRRRSG